MENELILKAINKDTCIIPSYHTNEAFYFAVGVEKPDNIIIHTGSYHSCREGFTSHVTANLNAILNTNSFGIIAASIPKPMEDKRAGKFYLDEKSWPDFAKRCDARIEKALRFINMFEKEVHWKRTVAHPLIIDDKDNGYPIPAYFKACAYYLKTSRQWLRSTHLVSLFMLLIRNGTVEKFPEFESLDRAVEILKICQVSDVPMCYGSDREHIRDTAECWIPLMKGSKDLYKGNIGKWWDRSLFGGANLSYEGVTTLATGRCCSGTVKSKFTSLMKQWHEEVAAAIKEKASKKAAEAEVKE